MRALTFERRRGMTEADWSKPAAKAIPKEGYFELAQGRFGPVFPRTPACYGFTVIMNLEGWPEDWRTNLQAVIKFFRDHQRPSFLEYGEYPYVSATEIKKALRLKAAFGAVLDEMQ